MRNSQRMNLLVPSFLSTLFSLGTNLLGMSIGSMSIGMSIGIGTTDAFLFGAEGLSNPFSKTNPIATPPTPPTPPSYHNPTSPFVAEWIQLDSDGNIDSDRNINIDSDSNSNRITPHRSGHVSFEMDGRLFVFGGYAEEWPKSNEGGDTTDSTGTGTGTTSGSGMPHRYAVNDLWVLDTVTPVTPTRTRTRTSTTAAATTTDKDAPASASAPVLVPDTAKFQLGWNKVEQVGDVPEERLVSDVSVLNGKAYLFGGWNPQTAGTGGVILSTIHRLDQTNDTNNPNKDTNTYTYRWTKLSTPLPDGPTSRHVVLTLPCQTKALLHTHRCNESNPYIYIFDATTETFTKYKTFGDLPNSRGLHAGCMLGGSFAMFFGGAAQDGNMSNECFLLNTLTYEWKRVEITNEVERESDACCYEKKKEDNNDDDDGMAATMKDIPEARAAPSLVRWNETCAILYGGAKSSPTQGLQALGDVWAITVNRFRGTGQWHRLTTYPDTLEGGNDASSSFESQMGVGETVPPPRNAATLNVIDWASSSTSSTGLDSNVRKNEQDYLLSGGWKPFRVTFGDSFMLRVRKR